MEGLLDNLRSAYNVGSLFRTAEGAGLGQLHLAGITATPSNLRVAKTALGAEKRVPWRYYRNALEAAEAVRARGVELWALEGGPRAEWLFGTAPPSDAPVCLVAGNELAGVDPALLERCQRVLSLPMAGDKQSLNVAVAFGIAVYWLRYGRALEPG
jgi:tRNA G18 (ribose-2'-O)-methylase SpoU